MVHEIARVRDVVALQRQGWLVMWLLVIWQSDRQVVVGENTHHCVEMEGQKVVVGENTHCRIEMAGDGSFVLK